MDADPGCQVKRVRLAGQFLDHGLGDLSHFKYVTAGLRPGSVVELAMRCPSSITGPACPGRSNRQFHSAFGVARGNFRVTEIAKILHPADGSAPRHVTGCIPGFGIWRRRWSVGGLW